MGLSKQMRGCVVLKLKKTAKNFMSSKNPLAETSPMGYNHSQNKIKSSGQGAIPYRW